MTIHLFSGTGRVFVEDVSTAPNISINNEMYTHSPSPAASDWPSFSAQSPRMRLAPCSALWVSKLLNRLRLNSTHYVLEAPLLFQSQLNIPSVRSSCLVMRQIRHHRLGKSSLCLMLMVTVVFATLRAVDTTMTVFTTHRLTISSTVQIPRRVWRTHMVPLAQ